MTNHPAGVRLSTPPLYSSHHLHARNPPLLLDQSAKGRLPDIHADASWLASHKWGSVQIYRQLPSLCTHHSSFCSFAFINITIKASGFGAIYGCADFIHSSLQVQLLFPHLRYLSAWKSSFRIHESCWRQAESRKALIILESEHKRWQRSVRVMWGQTGAEPICFFFYLSLVFAVLW